MSVKLITAVASGCDHTTTPCTSIGLIPRGRVKLIVSSSATGRGGRTFCSPNPPRLKFLASAVKEPPLFEVMLTGTFSSVRWYAVGGVPVFAEERRRPIVIW